MPAERASQSLVEALQTLRRHESALVALGTTLSMGYKTAQQWEQLEAVRAALQLFRAEKTRLCNAPKVLHADQRSGTVSPADVAAFRKEALRRKPRKYKLKPAVQPKSEDPEVEQLALGIEP
jgi:hypothetical protein